MKSDGGHGRADRWKQAVVIFTTWASLFFTAGAASAEKQMLVGYDTEGKAVWNVLFSESDYIKLYPPDSSAGVFVERSINERCELLQYDQRGQVINSTRLGSDCGTDVLVRDSVAYVTDWFEDANGGTIGMVSAYEVSGELLWSIEIEGVRLFRVLLDPDGDILLRGSDSNAEEYLVAKLRQDGVLEWEWRLMHGETSEGSTPSWVALNNGSVVFAGDAYTENSEHPITLTVGIDAQGNENWRAEFGKNSSMNGPRMAADHDGNVYVVNECELDTGCLAKYDHFGNEIWQEEFNYYVYSYEAAPIAVRQGGGPVFAVNNWKQINVFAYGPSGGLAWDRQLVGTEIPYDKAYDIAADRDGSTYVTASYCLKEGYDTQCDLRKYFTTAFDSFGNQLWEAFSDDASAEVSAQLASEAALIVLYTDTGSQLVLDPELAPSDGFSLSASDDDDSSSACGC